MISTRIPLLLLLVALGLGLGAVPRYSLAADEDCVEKGGKAQCSAPKVGKSWRYNACDDHAPEIRREAEWCTLRGSAWNSNDSSCPNPAPFTEESLVPLSEQFESDIQLSCGQQFVDTGWGVTTNSYQCGSAGTVMMNGVEKSGRRILEFNGQHVSGASCIGAWNEDVILSRDRDITCPAGSNTRTLGTDLECWTPPRCERCAGNPIDLGNGSKRQSEVDFRFPGPGGLEFVRYYNSSGFYSRQAREPVASDFWRNTFDRFVIQFKLNPYALAGVQRPDGTLMFFDGNGNEIHNIFGAGHRLDRVLDGGGNTIGWKLTSPEGDVEEYPAELQQQIMELPQRVTKITTRTGLTYTVNTGPDGLASVVDSFGRQLTFTSAEGFVTSMTDPDGQTYHYNVDSNDNLESVLYPDGSSRHYLYEDSNWEHALTGITDETGQRFATYSYDSLGRAATSEHAGGRGKVSVSYGGYSSLTTTYVYDAFGTSNSVGFKRYGGVLKGETVGGQKYFTETHDAYGNPLLRTDALGNQTSFTYDPIRNVELSRTEAYGTSLARTTATEWNPTYRFPSRITEPSVNGISRITDFTYDTAGNLVQRKVTAGSLVRQWNFTYDGFGRLLTLDGPRTDVNDTWTITYYPDDDTCLACRGQVKTITNPLGHLTSFDTYDLDGRLTQLTDPNGVATTFAWLPRGWLSTRTTGGETTTYNYDPAGRLQKVTRPDGSWMHYTYDDAGDLVGVDNSGGDAIDYELDAMGNRVQTLVYGPTDDLARESDQVFDSMNRLSKAIGSQYQTTTYSYDNYSDLKTVSDPLYHSTTYTYDALLRITQMLDPAGKTTIFGYDALDRLSSVKDAKNLTTTYTYDGLDNLLSLASPDTGTANMTYDDAGNMITRTDSRTVSMSYTYDALDRPTAATTTDGSTTYTYDQGTYGKGHLTGFTDPSGQTSLAYDALGRLASKTQTVGAKAFTVSYGWSSGQLASITYPSGHVIAYQYDAGGRPSSLSIDGAGVLSQIKYYPFGPPNGWTFATGDAYKREIDTDGRVSSVTLGPSAGTYSDIDQTYGYDPMDRLASASLAAGQSQSFTYDGVGNRLTGVINAASTTYTYPGTSHRLSSLSGAVTRSFTYDPAGYLTASQGITFTYDGRGRMKQAGTTTYLVNALGQRVKKTTGAAETYFAYDEAGHLVGEYDAAGSPIEETVWLGDTPVAVVRPAAGGGSEVFFVWTDQLDTPRVISDDENRIRWEWDANDPFGNNAPNEDPSGLGAFTYNLRFPGQYYDAETGLSYNYFRDYDPSIGRFAVSDPLGLVAGPSTYSYAGNNPISRIDPTGLAGIDTLFMPDNAPLVVAGRALGGIAAYIEGMATGNDALTNEALQGLNESRQANLEVLALLATMGRPRVAPEICKVVIGRGADLAKPGALHPGEYTLNWPSKLPDWRAEWKENAGRLREAMSYGHPIRDASPGDTGGPFLNAERNLLKDRGWTFNPKTNYWDPPKPR